MLYAKFISTEEVLHAPENYEGWTNFNTDEELMRSFGFLPLAELNTPESLVVVKTQYKQLEGKITLTFIEGADLLQVKAWKLGEIKRGFLAEEENGFVVSSLGFYADATRTSKQDIDGLITAMEATGLATVNFRDYENQFHELTLEQLKILRMEIIQKGLDMYAKKWQLSTLIDSAETIEAVKAIMW